MEIDPDVRLAARLTFGRRWWRLAVQATMVAIVIAGSGRDGLLTRIVRDLSWVVSGNLWPVQGDPGLLIVAILAALSGPGEVLRILELERRGVFDHIRMCGRTPFRILATFLGAYASVPIVASALLVTINALAYGGGFAVAGVIALLLLVALDAALLGFSLVGEAAQLPQILFSYAVAGTTIYHGWFAEPALRGPQAAVAAAALIALPLAVRLACARIARPAPRFGRPVWTSPISMLARLVPRTGPPELLCRLRRTIIQRARLIEVVAAMFLASLVIAVLGRAAGWPQVVTSGAAVFMNVLVFTAVIFAAVAIGTTIRTDFQSGGFDLVRLTGQKAETVAAGSYIGLALPFWLLALAMAVVLLFAPPDMFGLLPTVSRARVWRSLGVWAFVAGPAMVIPAVALLEAFQRRPPATYIVYASAAAYGLLRMLGGPAPSVATRRAHPVASELGDITGHVPTLFGDTIGVTAVVVVFVLATAIALGAVAGRIRRTDGPALVGVAAAAAVFGLGWSLRLLSVTVFPSVAAALMPLTASLFAEERSTPSPPWARVATAIVSTGVTLGLVAIGLGIDVGVAAASAAAGALALGAAMLGHELLHRWTPLALGLSVVLSMGIVWLARPAVAAASAGATCVIAAAAHAYVRGRPA